MAVERYVRSNFGTFMGHVLVYAGRGFSTISGFYSGVSLCLGLHIILGISFNLFLCVFLMVKKTQA